MKILKAKTMGFCMGVRRAVHLLENTIEDFPDRPIYTFGPIIHNKQVIGHFEKLGVLMADKPDEIPSGAIAVIRAHGIPPKVRTSLVERDITIVEGTCPKVIASQKIVSKYNSDGYHVVILGDRNHGEIVGLAGFADSVTVLETPEQAESFQSDKPVLVIPQTTIKYEEFDKICSILKMKNQDITVKNTICPATKDRQDALRELSSQVDAIIVVGGLHSANTQRLTITAKETGLPTWHIEKPTEITSEMKEYSLIGITAGASTPDFIIKQIEDLLLKD